MSSIQDFYSKQTIFLTGATGFLGKLLIEKFLRTCPDLEKMYVLVREKPNKTINQRVKELFDSACFEELKKCNPEFLQKVCFLNGDCTLPMLGLSAEAQDILKSEVSCVIHVAANVRFDTDLRTAVYTNVRSVKELMDLGTHMKQLKSFIYVSTAFSHCYRKDIREEFYEVDMKPENLIKIVDTLDEKTLNSLTPLLLGAWPNTYVYTKAHAEEVIRRYKQVLPVAIVRPVVVASTEKEPVSGWIEGFQGLVGIVLGVSLGVLRSLHLNHKLKAQLIPADYVVNCVIAAGWNINDNNGLISVYNCCPTKDNMITWGWLIEFLKSFTFVYPLSDAVWYRYIQTSKYELVHKVRVFFYHTLFSYLVDAILFLAGKGTLAVGKYRKINKLISVLSYFTTHEWNMDNANLVKLHEKLDERDKKMYDFDMRQLNWENYLEKAIVGGRKFLMKDSVETIPTARRKMHLLRVLHYLFVALLFYFWYWLLSPVFRLFL